MRAGTTSGYPGHGALIVAIVLLAAGCAGKPPAVVQDGPPPEPLDIAMIPDAEPRHEPRSRYGNPVSYEVFGKRYYLRESRKGYVERGIASWYGTKFHGRRTSSGEPFDMYAMTAAHTSLPIPVYARVTNLENGREVVVKINDRGPFAHNRIIDLSWAAAVKLGMAGQGTARVEVRTIDMEPETPELLLAQTASDDSEPDRPPLAPGGTVYIQTGAYASRDSAEKMLAQLSLLTVSVTAWINEVVIGDRQLYRVRLGPLASAGEINDAAHELESMGVADYRIVTD